MIDELPADAKPYVPPSPADGLPPDAKPYTPEAVPVGLAERFSQNVKAGFGGTLTGAAVNYFRDPMAVAAEREQYETMQPFYDVPGLGGKIAAGATALTGSVLGSLPSPESLFVPARGYQAVRFGAPLVREAVKDAAIQAGALGAANVGVQGINIAGGNQQEFSPAEVVTQAGTGAAFGAAGPVVGRAVNAMVGRRFLTPLDIMRRDGVGAAEAVERAMAEGWTPEAEATPAATPDPNTVAPDPNVAAAVEPPLPPDAKPFVPPDGEPVVPPASEQAPPGEVTTAPGEQVKPPPGLPPDAKPYEPPPVEAAPASGASQPEGEAPSRQPVRPPQAEGTGAEPPPEQPKGVPTDAEPTVAAEARRPEEVPGVGTEDTQGVRTEAEAPGVRGAPDTEPVPGVDRGRAEPEPVTGRPGEAPPEARSPAPPGEAPAAAGERPVGERPAGAEAGGTGVEARTGQAGGDVAGAPAPEVPAAKEGGVAAPGAEAESGAKGAAPVVTNEPIAGAAAPGEAPLTPADAKRHFAEQARQINGGTMNEAAKAGKAPADGTLLWFLDGDKATYSNTPGSEARLYRGGELAGYKSIDTPDGSRIWFKEGAEAQAQDVAQALQLPHGPERDRALGLALGYAPEDVERHVASQAEAPAAKVTTASGKTPVTAQEYAALQRERNQAATAVRKAEKGGDAAATDKARAELTRKQAALDAAEGPPKKPATMGKALMDAHREATATHEALVERRARAETPEAPALEARKPKHTPGIGTTAEKAADAAKHNRGASPYGAIWRDAGMDPAVAVNLPIARQSAIAKTQMQAAFGFKNVTSAVSHPDTVQQLATMYQNAKGMAHALGMPYEEISLNGRLSLHLEPRNEDYLGIYSPGRRSIGIADRSNSFAHEWTHAWDHQLADELFNNTKAMKVLSETQLLRSAKFTPGSKAEAFAKVVGALYGTKAHDAIETLRLQYQGLTSKDPAKRAAVEAALKARETEFAKAARVDPYYYRPAEMLARSHEAYTAHKIELTGLDTRGISATDRLYSAEGREAINRNFEKLYPKAEDRAAIFEAWDRMHEKQREETIAKGRAPGARPSLDDMLDPSNWHILADTKENPRDVGLMTREIRAWKGGIRKIAQERLGIDRSRPQAPHSMLEDLAHTGRTIGYSVRGVMEALAHRYKGNSAAHGAFQELIDHFAPVEGIRSTTAAQGRGFGPVYEQAVSRAERSYINQFTNILVNNDLKNMTREQADQMQRFMTSGDPTGANTPANIRKAAEELRLLLNSEHARNRNVGIDLGYTENAYYPRLYDTDRIGENVGSKAAFEKDAARAYLHVYDRDVTERADMLEAYSKLSPRALGSMPVDVIDKVNELRANERRRPRLEAEARQLASDIRSGASADPAADRARIAAITTDLQRLASEADQLHQEVEPYIRHGFADDAARDWTHRLTVGDPVDFESRGPASRYTKERHLTPEADAIMQPWIITDPRVAITEYFKHSARRVAFAERFEADASGLEAYFDRMESAGVHESDIKAMRGYVEHLTGRQRSDIPNQLTQWTARLHALGSMALMTRSAFTSLGEPMAALARTGSLKTALTAYANQIGDVFRTVGSDERRLLADVLGITTSPLYDSVVNSRIGSHYDNIPSLNAMVTNYYQRIGLTQLTNSQRRSMMAAGHQALTAWGKDFLEGTARAKREAAAQFRDLGVGDADHEMLARYLRRQDGALPDSRLFSGTKAPEPGALLWADAITSLTNQVIQDPMKVDKPLLSTHPLGRLAFGLMAFNYAFYHNIVERTFSRYGARIGEASGVWGKTVELGRAGKDLGMAAAGIYIASLAATVVREAMFNSTKWQEMDLKGQLMDWLSDLAIQRTGVNGPIDPILQMITGLKFEKSATGIFTGAQAGFFIQAAEKMLQPLIRSSPYTNTADHNALEGAYNMFAVPMEAVGLTAVPGGPFTGRAAGLGLMYLTGRDASNKFADTFVGPKGSRMTKPGEKLLGHTGVGGGGDKKKLLPGLKGPAGGEDEEGPGMGGTVGGVPIGLVDDLAAPAAQRGLPLLARLPGPLKVLGVGAGAAAAGSELADRFARYTQPPSNSGR